MEYRLLIYVMFNIYMANYLGLFVFLVGVFVIFLLVALFPVGDLCMECVNLFNNNMVTSPLQYKW